MVLQRLNAKYHRQQADKYEQFLLNELRGEKDPSRLREFAYTAACHLENRCGTGEFKTIPSGF